MTMKRRKIIVLVNPTVIRRRLSRETPPTLYCRKLESCAWFYAYIFILFVGRAPKAHRGHQRSSL